MKKGNMQAKTASDDIRLMVVGAHPDDCEARAGGLAALYRRRGWSVTFVSTTNGDAGHHAAGRAALAERRRAEARAVSEKFGIAYEIFDVHDGELEPDLANRQKLIRLIRSLRPDLLLTHRPNDYHPDHRYTAILVQDASFLVTVPMVCDDTPALSRDPVIAHFRDHFTKPVPFVPSVAVNIGEAIEDKMRMFNCHASQFYEWLPFRDGELGNVPAGNAERRRFLMERWHHMSDPEPCRAALIRRYGTRKGSAVRYAECFEASEYGTPLDDENRGRLFPF